MKNNEIGLKLRQARQALGLTQSEVAERCGWGDQQSRVGHYERGIRGLDVNHLQILAQALQKPICWFFDECTGQVSHEAIRNTHLMRRCIEMILDAEAESGQRLSSEQKARLVVALYNDAVRTHKSPSELSSQDILPLLEVVG
jgi:transcriptional regulator with XRE-family HTH domain